MNDVWRFMALGFIASNAVLGSAVMLVQLDDALYAGKAKINGEYRKYITAMLLFYLGFASSYIVLVSLAVLSFFDISRDVITFPFLASQLLLTLSMFLLLVVRYRIWTNGVTMSDVVVVEPKKFYLSKSMWLGVAMCIVFTAEYIEMNINVLGLGGQVVSVVMFVTGLLGGLGVLVTRLLTGSPIEGSPAHASAIRGSGNS